MRVLDAIRARLADERGFTLVEVLMAAAVGMVVLLGASQLLDVSTRASTDVQNRADAVDKGRTAMKEIVDRLRAQSCLNESTPAIVKGQQNSIDFYTVFGATAPQPTIYGNTTASDDSVTARRIEWVPYGGSRDDGYLQEKVWNTVDRTNAANTFNATPNVTRMIMDRVAPVKSGSTTTPIFRYYKFRGTDPGIPDLEVPLASTTATLSDDDEARVVKIDVTFDARPGKNTKAARTSIDSTFANEVFVRTADARAPESSPECL
jgi:Tfp pilus assembly protein PilV